MGELRIGNIVGQKGVAVDLPSGREIIVSPNLAFGTNPSTPGGAVNGITLLYNPREAISIARGQDGKPPVIHNSGSNLSLEEMKKDIGDLLSDPQKLRDLMEKANRMKGGAYDVDELVKSAQDLAKRVPEATLALPRIMRPAVPGGPK